MEPPNYLRPVGRARIGDAVGGGDELRMCREKEALICAYSRGSVRVFTMELGLRLQLPHCVVVRLP